MASDFEYLSNDIRRQFFRFYELVDLYNKVDGRRQLFFEDRGYVEDVDLFLTGIICNFPINIFLDGSTLEWKVLNCPKQFKTMLDFYTDKIRCQGLLFTELQGHERHRFKNAELIGHVINPGAEDREQLSKFMALS